MLCKKRVLWFLMVVLCILVAGSFSRNAAIIRSACQSCSRLSVPFWILLETFLSDFLLKRFLLCSYVFGDSSRSCTSVLVSCVTSGEAFFIASNVQRKRVCGSWILTPRCGPRYSIFRGPFFSVTVVHFDEIFEIEFSRSRRSKHHNVEIEFRKSAN